MKRILFLTVALALTIGTTFAQGGRGYDSRDDVYTNNDGRYGNGPGGYGPQGGPGYGGPGRPGGARGGACGPGATGGRWIDNAEYVQQSRIYQGIRNGSLNRWEAQRLQRELGRIEHMEWDFRRNDGRLDGRERRILDSELDRLAWNVRRERNDGDRRWY